MSTYIPVIGLEIHAELKTKSKMFCTCKNDPNETRPNTNICPICMGHPGTLPVANKAAIESMIKIGMAVGGEIPAVSKFDRKNYFYPDIPKGYQISQFDVPLVFGGMLKGVKLTRVHLEEDTASSIHRKDSSGTEITLVDFNRAGTALMELVTEPDIREVKQIGDFGRELQLLLRYLNVSDADMEKGQMRVEVNLSLGTIVDGELKFGTKVEVKNIASFNMAERAAQYEIKRQREILEHGGTIEQETRGWDDPQQKTVSQRKKESSHDYRYFPEPDLPPIDLAQFDFRRLKSELPELPGQKRVRFASEYELTPEQIEVLVFDSQLAQYFEDVISELKEELRDTFSVKKHAALAINYLSSDLKGLMISAGITDPDKTKVTAENLADLVILVASDKITSRVAKDVLKLMFDTSGDPNVIIKEQGLEQVSDESALIPICQQLIDAHPGPAADYKKGKEAALMFFVGRAMGQLKGKGNPAVLQKLFRELLSR
jgi:aspartyl-tRNA(Asn)/glutamyl-tRNA(Gln) amidotransferase subunit B